MTNQQPTASPTPFPPPVDPAHHAYRNPPVAARRASWHWVPWVAAAVVAAFIVAAGATIWIATRSDRDAHATAACQLLEQAKSQPLLDAVISQIKAVKEAQASNSPGLREAANRVSLASSLPVDSPLYANPGDVQSAAVADWCRQHR